jgi:hypothetical protein
LSPEVLIAAAWDPAAPDYSGHKGKTFFVSKLGDDSDGSSWQKAFRTIQAALLAVPDNQGGHRIIVRPDTYVEANLYVKHKGAPGAYNLIAGDFDGRLGSGATGWVVVDCSAPGVAARLDPTRGGNWKIIKSDEPESGFKSVDWWGNFAGPPGTFSNFGYDRRIFRHIYSTGGEGGFGLYTVGEECKAPCTMVVEDCVGIGRFAGAVLAGGVGRHFQRDHRSETGSHRLRGLHSGRLLALWNAHGSQAERDNRSDFLYDQGQGPGLGAVQAAVAGSELPGRFARHARRICSQNVPVHRGLGYRQAHRGVRKGHSCVRAFGDGKRLHVFATEGTDHDWFESMYRFWTEDLKTWNRELVFKNIWTERRGGRSHEAIWSEGWDEDHATQRVVWRNE